MADMVKLVDIRCPSCGANMSVDLESSKAACAYCGAMFPIDNGSLRVRVETDAEKLGYEFEKGRQRAQAEAGANAQAAPKVPRKRRTWLWVLGWIFIFPVPLTVLMLRTDKVSKPVAYLIIALGWLVYLALGVGSGSR